MTAVRDVAAATSSTVAAMRVLPPTFRAYTWAAQTDEVAASAGIDPHQVLRFDQNTSPLPLRSARPGTVAGALAGISGYRSDGYRPLIRAIADYAGVEPANVVLGAGADDLILLCARAFAGPGDRVVVPAAPTYPLYRIAAELAGATVCEQGDSDILSTGYEQRDPDGALRGDTPLGAAPMPREAARRPLNVVTPAQTPALTFDCRPNNPTGEIRPLPSARPLVVDEAYIEFGGESAVGLLDDGVIVIRTFSKLFALAGARVGYALASADVAAELTKRQAPAPVSSLSAELAIAALADRPDPAPVLAERDRVATALRGLGLDPLPSQTNFLYVPVEDGLALGSALLDRGLVVRSYERAIRLSIRDPDDDDVLLDALAAIRARAEPVAAPVAGASTAGACALAAAAEIRTHRRARHVRATAETRIAVRLGLDGASRVHVSTGAGLYDHLLEQLAFHAGFDLVIEGAGDLETGDHHTAEDTALAFGEALDAALADRRGIRRYGDAVVPMDDALAKAAVDLGGRPFAELSIDPDPGMADHVLQSLSQAGRLAIHVAATGRDSHHTAEAAFKAVGRALRDAVRVQGDVLPSTKGVL